MPSVPAIGTDGLSPGRSPVGTSVKPRTGSIFMVFLPSGKAVASVHCKSVAGSSGMASCEERGGTHAHTCAWTHMRAHRRAHTGVCTHVNTWACAYRHAHTSIHRCAHTGVHTKSCTQACTHRHVHAQAYLGVHTGVHMGVHTQACAHRRAQGPALPPLVLCPSLAASVTDHPPPPRCCPISPPPNSACGFFPAKRSCRALGG